MSDPVSVVSLALTLSTKATDALNALREHSKTTKDLDIKDKISTLYDNVLELKEVIVRLSDENKELKAKLENQQLSRAAVPKIKQVGETNHYFQGDEGPYCQVCYDKNTKLVALLPTEQTPWGSIRRTCPVCREIFYELKAKTERAQIVPRVVRY
jgi:regulator of replication initiation timing